jgi:hypothetical protein
MYKIIGADGREYGPVSAEQLRQWIAEGRANPQTLMQAVGSTEWKPLTLFQELSPSMPPTALPAPKTNSMAVAGLVFGLLGLMGGWFCCCGPLFNMLGIVFSIVGLSQIKHNPSRETGRGIAMTGLVLSILGLVAMLILGVLFGAMRMLGHPPMGWHQHWRL